MTGPRADQMREEQQRQTDDLTTAIRALLREHAEREPFPMLGAAVSALAQNLGESIGQIERGPARKSLRNAAEKIRARAERQAPKLGHVHTVEVRGKH